MLVACCDHDLRNFHLPLLEHYLAPLVANNRVAEFPLNLIEGVDTDPRKKPLERQALRRCPGRPIV